MAIADIITLPTVGLSTDAKDFSKPETPPELYEVFTCMPLHKEENDRLCAILRASVARWQEAHAGEPEPPEEKDEILTLAQANIAHD